MRQPTKAERLQAAEIDRLHERIADLEAEVERLRAQQWVPVDDREWEFSFTDSEGTVCVPQDLCGKHVLDIYNKRTGVILVLPDNLRLCKRGDA